MEELLPLLAEAAPDLQEVLGILKDFGAILSGLRSPLGFAQEAANLFADGIKQATQAVIGIFQSLVGAIGPFVQALNPSLMMAVNQAMESLKATVGVALVPVAKVLVNVIRQVAGILLPAMQAIAPVMGTLARVVGDFIIPPFLLLADVLQGFAPLFEMLAEMVEALAEGLKALSVVSRSLIQTFIEFVKNLFGAGDMKGFRDSVHKVAEALLKLVAYLAKSFGALSFIDKMVKNLRDLGTAKTGAAPAPKDAGIKGFEDIAKTLATSAFAAMGGASADKNDEKKWREDVAKTLEDVKKNGKTLEQFLNQMMDKFETWLGVKLRNLPGEIADAMNPFE